MEVTLQHAHREVTSSQNLLFRNVTEFVKLRAIVYLYILYISFHMQMLCISYIHYY